MLAGAHVDALSPQKQTALHLAAEKDHSAIVSLLLENHAQYDKVDDSLNNALHIACQHGHLATARVLLTESQINAEAVNIKYVVQHAVRICILLYQHYYHYFSGLAD